MDPRRRLTAAAGLLAGLALMGAGHGEAGAPPSPEPGTPEPQAPAEEVILGAPAALPPQRLEGQREWLASGARLRREPAGTAPVLRVVDARIEVDVLERRGAWVRVQYGGLRGWVYLGGEPREDPSGLWLGPLAQPADPDRLARAQALLPEAGRALALGPFALSTDVADEGLLAELASVASGVEEAFHRRLEVAPLPAAGEAVIVFGQEGDYRAFTGEETSLGGLDSHGHAGNGLAVLGAAGRSHGELRHLLVHELAHLVSRRSLGTELPPWLDEGLAEDLAYCRIDPDGRLRLGTLDGEISVKTTLPVDPLSPGQRFQQVSFQGPRAALTHLARSLGKAGTPSLEELVGLPWSDFVEPGRRDLLYAESAFFVRFLLDGDGGSRARPFRSYLALLASGERPDPADLAARLGTSWEELQRGFEAWVRVQAAAGATRGSAPPP